ncbi:MAG: stage 0 sporulation family protein [Deltaproteobacteria bacterium]|nr:stage 0 sporulation family protein [Deltaproteobacteria bacterium]
MVKVVGVRFKKACKVYDFDSNNLELSPGDSVIVEVERGLGLGIVAYIPKEVDPATLTRPLKKVVRKADPVDLERNGFNTERENEAFRICKDKIAHYHLPMKLIRVEYLFDSSKAIFYFTSETRVDFRELVKDLAAGFHTRIEMRQIGVRDEAKMIGGLGPCGRELCCAGFLSDFEPVTIKMAKEQNLALNPVKISGICGRLMCCLSYEHDMYQGEKHERKDRGDKGDRGGDKDKVEKSNNKHEGGCGGGCGGGGKHGGGHHHGHHSHARNKGQNSSSKDTNNTNQDKESAPQEGA